jgi:methionyl-tRNA formyltransferase
MDSLKILYCGYRNWSLRLHKLLLKKLSFDNVTIDLVTSANELKSAIQNKYDLVFFIGWSSIVEMDIVQNNICVALHPSMLPRFRGGSPIQNQILEGILDSGITLFLMDRNLDTGPILRQTYLSLDGELKSIFNRIVSKALPLILSIITEFKKNGKLISTPQDESLATFYNRRSPKMSEITLEEIQKSNALDIYNKIRSLQDPYPNAFIRFKDGSILYITKARLMDE